MPGEKPFEGGFRHQLDSLFPWPGKINYDFVAQNAIDRPPTKTQEFGNLSNAEMSFDLLRDCCHLLLVCDLRTADKLPLGQLLDCQ